MSPAGLMPSTLLASAFASEASALRPRPGAAPHRLEDLRGDGADVTLRPGPPTAAAPEPAFAAAYDEIPRPRAADDRLGPAGRARERRGADRQGRRQARRWGQRRDVDGDPVVAGDVAPLGRAPSTSPSRRCGACGGSTRTWRRRCRRPTRSPAPGAHQLAGRLMDARRPHRQAAAGRDASRPRRHRQGLRRDRCAASCEATGLADFMVQAGGDLFVAGSKGRPPWRVGIRDPRGPGRRTSPRCRIGITPSRPPATTNARSSSTASATTTSSTPRPGTRRRRRARSPSSRRPRSSPTRSTTPCSSWGPSAGLALVDGTPDSRGGDRRRPQPGLDVEVAGGKLVRTAPPTGGL